MTDGALSDMEQTRGGKQKDSVKHWCGKRVTLAVSSFCTSGSFKSSDEIEEGPKSFVSWQIIKKTFDDR